MHEAGNQRKVESDDRAIGGKIHAYAAVGFILVMALIIGTPVVMAITFFNWPIIIAYLAVVLVLYRLAKRRVEALDMVYLRLLESEGLETAAALCEPVGTGGAGANGEAKRDEEG